MQARGTGGKPEAQQQGKEAQMCLFSGNNKKGRPGASVTQAAIARKLGIMFRTRRSSGFAPRALLYTRSRPLAPTTHSPPSLCRSPAAYPYTRVRRRFRLLIKTRVREGFQGFLPGSP